MSVVSGLVIISKLDTSRSPFHFTSQMSTFTVPDSTAPVGQRATPLCLVKPLYYLAMTVRFLGWYFMFYTVHVRLAPTVIFFSMRNCLVRHDSYEACMLHSPVRCVIYHASTPSCLKCTSPCFFPCSAGGFDQTVTIKVGVRQIDSNALYAICPGNTCQFQYLGASTPQISDWTGAGTAGKNFRATGALLQQSLAAYNIKAGGVTCTVDPENSMWTRPDQFLWDGYVG